MMRSLYIKDKISELGVTLPSAESFWGTGDLTALRHNNDVGFYRSNYERGLLVYALVAAHRPKVVLEFGTGRGYGSLCMARAFVEHDIEGTITPSTVADTKKSSHGQLTQVMAPESTTYLGRMFGPNIFRMPGWNALNA